jgi:bifunctional non-homologous end joining protein LigD
MPHHASSLVRALSGANPAPFPNFIAPCLATLRSSVPNGGAYLHELKLDGYRIQAHLQDGRVTLYTRSGLDWTSRFATIAAGVARLHAGNLVLDGEIISADPDGRPNFSALQDDLKRGRHDRFVYYAFDLLHLDGLDTRPAALIERKRALRSVLDDGGASAPRLLYSEHFEDGADLYKRVSAMNLEGVVSKRADALSVGAWRSLDQGKMLEAGTLRRGRLRTGGVRGPAKASTCSPGAGRIDLCGARWHRLGSRHRAGYSTRP